jgi:Fe-S-cluster-containing dehydrogenase component
LSAGYIVGRAKEGPRPQEANVVIFDMLSCGGCRTCEMACSFHHRGEFIPSLSSIKVLDKENEPGFFVLFMKDNEGQSIACDGCRKLDIPLCMQYCKESEDLEKILREFLGKAKPGEKAKRGRVGSG